MRLTLLILLPLVALAQLRNGTLRNGTIYGPAPYTDPEALPVGGYSLWLHADYYTFTDAGTNTAAGNGSRVGMWLDRSGNGYHCSNCVLTLLERPLLSNNVWNGHSALRFGLLENDGLQHTASNIDYAVCTIAVVGSSGPYALPSGKAAQIFGLGDSPNFNWARIGLDDSFPITNRVLFKASDGIGSALAWHTNAITTNGYKGYVWIARLNSTSSVKITENGNTVTGSDGLAINPYTGPYSVGWWRSQTNSSAWNGMVAQVVVWPFVMTDLQVSNVNHYLTNYYGLSQ